MWICSVMKGTLCTLVLLGCVLGISSSGLPQDLINEIAAHQADVDRIIDYVLSGAGHHGMYNQLAEFSDDYGPRMSGTEDLEIAINYTLTELENDGFENVGEEEVEVPHWTRGDQEAYIITPRHHDMYVLALGRSIGTPPGGITADVIVVRSFEELNDKSAEVQGKIVVYNEAWTNYGETVEYRNRGASEAAKHGAVAALVRSVTPFSVNSPHIGNQDYEPGVTQIPVACVTVEDAEMMQRLQTRGKPISVFLRLSCEVHDEVMSRNVIAEYTGSTYPNEYVIIGGHIDTWDVGFGPMDDGGGVIMTWQAMKILKALNLVPKRTVRSIFWTGEEFGLIGAETYFERHKEMNASISLMMESDSGTFTAQGIGFSGAGYTRAIMEEVVMLLEKIDATTIGPDGSQPDTGEWQNIGVPVGSLLNANEDYFVFHHSHGDSITMEDPDVLDRCTIVWAAVTYVVANLEDKLPRSGDYPEPSPSSASSITSTFVMVAALSLVCISQIRRSHL